MAEREEKRHRRSSKLKTALKNGTNTGKSRKGEGKENIGLYTSLEETFDW